MNCQYWFGHQFFNILGAIPYRHSKPLFANEVRTAGVHMSDTPVRAMRFELIQRNATVLQTVPALQLWRALIINPIL